MATPVDPPADGVPTGEVAAGAGAGAGAAASAAPAEPVVEIPQVHPLLVLFGSQTGCAEDAAALIARGASRRGFKPRVMAMDAYDRASLPTEPLVVFVASTTGDGDAPDNMRKFWLFLRLMSLPPDSLTAVSVATFGLGDSSYAKYNAAARKLHTRLMQLGARSLCERGLGDDQSPLGVEADLDQWLQTQLWPALLRRHPLPAGAVVDDSPRRVPCAVAVDVVAAPGTAPRSAVACNAAAATLPAVPGAFCGWGEAVLTDNVRLTAADWQQDVRHLGFDLGALPLPAGGSYGPGDVAVVQPCNDGDGGRAVLELVQRLGMHPANTISIKPADGHDHCRFPATASLYELLCVHVDILAVPKRWFLEQLSFYASDEEQQEKLLEMCTTEGADIYHDYCVKARRTHVEVLQDFNSVGVPLAVLLTLIPPIKPRSFSIASADPTATHRMELCVAVVEYKTPHGRPKQGVCSSWLRSLAPGSRVLTCLKPGTLRLPADPSTPVVLVGPGTGVAPMRSLLQHRAHLQREAAAAAGAGSVPPDWGACHLYFGCRHRDKDFLYEADWDALRTSGTLTACHTAFSRDQAHKIYVQARVRETAVAVYDALVTKRGVLFIAGSAKSMPTDVTEAVQDVIAAVGKMSTADAKRQVALMAKQQRLVVEAWS